MADRISSILAVVVGVGCCLGCPGPQVGIPPAAQKSLLDLEDKKSIVQQWAHAARTGPNVSEPVKKTASDLYVAAKASHDAFLTGLILQIQTESQDQTVLDGKAKEASEKMEAFVKHLRDNKIEIRVAWVPIVAALVDLGIKLWKAYDETVAAEKKSLKEDLIKRITSLKLETWDLAK